MVTVFQRCSLKGYTDYPTTCMVGQLVAEDFIKHYPNHCRSLVQSTEPHGTFSVWSYPDSHSETIDEFIKKVNEIQRKDLKLPSEQALIDSVQQPKRKRLNG